VRSFINKFIWRGVRDTLFYYFYFWFPNIDYHPEHFMENVIKRYVKSRNTIKLQQLIDSYNIFDIVSEPRVELPKVSELGLSESFLNPLHKDPRIPWVEFGYDIIYEIKPFNLHIALGLNFKSTVFFFTGLQNFHANIISNLIFKKDSVIEFLINLEVLPIKYLYLRIINQLENLNNISFYFYKKPLYFLIRILHKKLFHGFFYA
jgi:hypothetical protein